MIAMRIYPSIKIKRPPNRKKIVKSVTQTPRYYTCDLSTTDGILEIKK